MCNIGHEKIVAVATDGYLVTTDIMDLLNVSNQTVYNFIKSGELKTDSGYWYGSRQRIMVEVEEFERFLKTKPKYYEKIYGEPLEIEEPEVIEVEEPEVTDTENSVLDTLFSKLEGIDEMIDAHLMEAERLKEQKAALEKVIDMF